MIINGIDTNDISVVVQGAIDQINTPKCLRNIRKRLPGAEIILSTWEGSPIDGLDYDKLVLNKDPGSFQMSPWETNNVKRQIVSTYQGLLPCRNKYALKIRSDIKITKPLFLKFFNKFNSFDAKWHFLKKRIIIPSMISRDPRFWESPMCPSDWCSFGLMEDMLNMWNIDLPTTEEECWFLNHYKPDVVKYFYGALEARYNPEQFIWINFIKKYVSSLHCNHMFDVNPQSITETLASFANNLIILSEKQFGIKFLKHGRKGSDKWHIITYNDFLRIYNQYCNAHKFIFPINIQRLSLLKHFFSSNSRLYKKAVENKKLGEYLTSETRYISSLLYWLCKPFIMILNRYEKRRQPELWWKLDETVQPTFSIVIPAHGRLKLLKETLNSIGNSDCKDFELIISDDSSKIKERLKIKKWLLALHREKDINIKYVFSRPNLGQSKNTNQGLNHIRGKWVRILHSDDIISPFLLSDEKRIIDKYPNTIAIFHNVIPFRNFSELELPRKNGFLAVHNADFIIQNSLHSFCALPSSLLFKAEIIKDTGKFDPDFIRACDWDFWARIVLHAKRTNTCVAHVDDSTIFYRDHLQNNSNKIKTKLSNYDEYKRIENKVSVFLKDYDFSEDYIRNYKNNALLYRKRRLISDYSALPTIHKIIQFKNFYKKLRDFQEVI